MKNFESATSKRVRRKCSFFILMIKLIQFKKRKFSILHFLKLLLNNMTKTQPTLKPHE
jgi:hypothetical protein